MGYERYFIIRRDRADIRIIEAVWLTTSGTVTMSAFDAMQSFPIDFGGTSRLTILESRKAYLFSSR